tara:strand:- start:1653 stop:1841 length:189 start_codon:yes stop_codon:yes gene_type:complete
MAIPLVAIGLGSLAILATDKITDLFSETKELTQETGTVLKTSGVLIVSVVVIGIIAYRSLQD